MSRLTGIPQTDMLIDWGLWSDLAQSVSLKREAAGPMTLTGFPLILPFDLLLVGLPQSVFLRRRAACPVSLRGFPLFVPFDLLAAGGKVPVSFPVKRS